MKLRAEVSRLIGRPAEEVFEAWVDPQKMSGYFISGGSARMEAGETVVWTWADYGGLSLDIAVKSVEPGRKLAFDWSATGVETRVVVEFQPEGDGATKVTVRDGDWESDVDGIRRYGEQIQGWVDMLLCLKAYLEYEQINLRQTPGEPCGVQTERLMTAKPAELYRKLTDQWDSWFCPPGSIRMDPAVGSPFWFDAIGENKKRYPHYGRFLRLEQDRVVELTWTNRAIHGVETRLKFELAPEAGGTRLRVSHTGFYDQATRDAHEAAWPQVLAHLDKCSADEAVRPDGED